MSNHVEEVSFNAYGEDAVETAMDFLKKFAEDGQFTHINVELSTKNRTGSSSVNQTEFLTEDADRSKEERAKGVRPGTSHHRVLSALNKFADEMPVSTKEILEEVDLPEGTAYAAMSDLHDRGLVKRTEEKNQNNSYEYEFTVAGEDELTRLGSIE